MGLSFRTLRRWIGNWPRQGTPDTSLTPREWEMGSVKSSLFELLVINGIEPGLAFAVPFGSHWHSEHCQIFCMVRHESVPPPVHDRSTTTGLKSTSNGQPIAWPAFNQDGREACQAPQNCNACIQNNALRSFGLSASGNREMDIVCALISGVVHQYWYMGEEIWAWAQAEVDGRVQYSPFWPRQLQNRAPKPE